MTSEDKKRKAFYLVDNIIGAFFNGDSKDSVRFYEEVYEMNIDEALRVIEEAVKG